MSQKSVSTTALKRFISYSVHFLSTHKDTLSDMIIVLDMIEVKLTLSQYTVQSFMSPFIDFFGKTSYYCGFTNVTPIVFSWVVLWHTCIFYICIFYGCYVFLWMVFRWGTEVFSLSTLIETSIWFMTFQRFYLVYTIVAAFT